MFLSVCLVTLLIVCDLSMVSGHGRLVVPPSRASMFRYGYTNPADYNDMQGFCGGFHRQQSINGGRCGICGDPWDATVREHEAGGKYANGIIVRQYSSGQPITVQVQITANHKGYFEFRLCVNNNTTKAATHECLDQNLLQMSDGSGTKYYVDLTTGIKQINMKLPDGIVCSQCVFQWKYHTGNSWGTDADGTSCLGCGPQEEFYGCADIAISSEGRTESRFTNRNNRDQPSTTTTSQPSTTTTSQPSTTTTSQPSTTKQPSTQLVPCHAIGGLANVVAYNQWCVANCALGNCPSTICSCEDEDEDTECLSHGMFKSVNVDKWCSINCLLGFCPETYCRCSTKSKK